VLQLLLNLLWNAIKFSPENGFIQIDSRPSGAFLELTVSDSGPGIAADVLPQLFNPFSRSAHTGETGAGLGLAIVRHIVELHHGYIRAENLQPGRGSRFIVLLPNATSESHHRKTA
jgi:signal transduction histidine kinase